MGRKEENKELLMSTKKKKKSDHTHAAHACVFQESARSSFNICVMQMNTLKVSESSLKN